MSLTRAQIQIPYAISSHLGIIFLLAFGAMAGLLLGDDYSSSLDEVRNARVGEYALKAYTGLPDYFSLSNLADHGPAYFMLFTATSKLVHGIAPSWSLADGRHLTNYMTFLVGIFFFYRLCLNFMSSRLAWLAATLLATQPLAFGYGFVNQKDIPFFTLFLATIVTGISAADQMVGRTAFSAREPAVERRTLGGAPRTRPTRGWHLLSLPSRMFLYTALALALLLLTDLFFLGSIHQLGKSMIAAAYDGSAPYLVQHAFWRVATDAYKTSLEAYLAKYETLFALSRMYLTVGWMGAGLIGARLGLESARLGSGIWRAVGQPAFLASAILLGITISVRQLGAFAGVLVGLQMLSRGRSRALSPILMYGSIAAVVTFATWPYLWPDPFGGFIGSVLHAANFPILRPLFKGSFVRSDRLPWDYFPTLAGLQLTEPAVLLILLGLATIVWRLARRKSDPSPITIMALWVGIPLVALILRVMPAYGIRHFLFILPPLFVCAGVGLGTFFERVRRKWPQAIALGVALLPGIIGIVGLHPYEPIYFNSLAGGVSGAHEEYTLDRWCLSYREAAQVVNGMARPEETVGVNTELRTVVPDYLRPDLKLLPWTEPVERAEFVINCVSPTRAEWPTEGFQLVFTVRRGTAVLAEVWQKIGGEER